MLETFQYGASVHSSGELGIQLASMLHLGAALPNLGFAADAHYHHLLDDIIVGGKTGISRRRDRRCRAGRGSASRSTATSSRQYAELYREIGGYPYDRDPGRPDWYAVMPETRYADPRLKDADLRRL